MAPYWEIYSLTYPSEADLDALVGIFFKLRNTGDAGTGWVKLTNNTTNYVLLELERPILSGSLTSLIGQDKITKRMQYLLECGHLSAGSRIKDDERIFFIDVIGVEPEPPPPPPPEPEPGPFDWLIELILSTVEYLIGFQFGTINEVIKWIQAFQLTLTVEIAKFFEDPIKYIQDAVDSIIPSMLEILTTVSNAIGAWWEDTQASIGDWWSDASKAVGDWVDSSFSNIGSWWESVRSSVVDWMQGTWTNITDFWNDVTSSIGKWWDDTKKAIWDGLQSAIGGLQSWIDSTVSSIGDWWDGVTAGIGEWWSDTIKGIGEAWEDFADGIGSVWDGIASAIGDAIDTAVKNIETWVNDTVPGIVEGMFSWALPLVQPIINAAGYLGQLTGLVTGDAPAEPEIEEARTKQKEIFERLEETIRRIRGF